MSEITRRRLLGSAAGAAGGAVASSLFGPNLSRALAWGTQPGGSPSDIEHVVILMEENRSFDHYFGTLSGVRGFADPSVLIQPNGRPVFYQADPNNPDGYLLPWHLDTQVTGAQAIPSTSHAWTVQHEAWNGGLMDSWFTAHIPADGAVNAQFVMGYYEREDVPYHFALAEAFTICDGYHCSLLGPTWPNRMYLMTGWNDPNATGGGPIISNVVPAGGYSWSTYPERLTAAGVSWHVYQEEDDYGCNPLEFFAQYQAAKPGSELYEHGLAISTPGQFERDVANGALPTVSWIIPTSGQSEHPAYIPAAGADFLASKLEALAANPEVWAKTLFILNYDENDGLFDHVPPPVPPAGTPDEFVDGLPIGGGIRVPCILVSPWTVGGWVASENFDHTSVLQLLELVTGVEEPNISAWRRATFGNFTSALGFSSGQRFPRLPVTLPDFYLAETEVATLPAPTPPSASQTPPVQETSRPPHILWGERQKTAAALTGALTAASRGVRQALPGTASRLEETHTTHRSDFPHGVEGTSFPGVLAKVSGVAVAASATTPLAYVTGLVGGNVAIVDASSYALVSAIESGVTNPYGIVATPDGSKLYVTNSGTNTVSVIDAATNAVSSDITVGLYPHGIAIAPNGASVYVANTGPDTGADGSPGPGGSNTVSVIDVATGAVMKTIDVGEAPKVVVVSADSSTVYVSCRNGVYVIDAANASVSAWDWLGESHGLAVSPDGSTLFATLPNANTLVVIDTAHASTLESINVGALPWNIALSVDGAYAYVTNADADTVSVVDTATRSVTATLGVGHVPTGISTDAGFVWVANNTSGNLSVIDIATQTVTETILLGLADEPTAIAFVR
jgi:phospholipase C